MPKAKRKEKADEDGPMKKKPRGFSSRGPSRVGDGAELIRRRQRGDEQDPIALHKGSFNKRIVASRKALRGFSPEGSSMRVR